jgi:hypothetical protein
MPHSPPTLQPSVQRIQEVIDQLDTIIAWAKEKDSPLAYFPCLYRRVTIRVKEGIAADRFEDGPRMEQLDVVFANRYFEAIHAYTQGNTPTVAWQAAFEAAENNQLLILQHLLLGINAHINLDLGIVASEIGQNSESGGLEKDFMGINQVLAEMVGEVQKDLNRLSPLFGVGDFLTRDRDEFFATFSIDKARDYAWKSANRLSPLVPDEKEAVIVKIDEYVRQMAQKIISPPVWFIRIGLWVVKLTESKAVKRNIEHLYK